MFTWQKKQGSILHESKVNLHMCMIIIDQAVPCKLVLSLAVRLMQTPMTCGYGTEPRVSPELRTRSLSSHSCPLNLFIHIITYEQNIKEWIASLALSKIILMSLCDEMLTPHRGQTNNEFFRALRSSEKCNEMSSVPFLLPLSGQDIVVTVVAMTSWASVSLRFSHDDQ